MLFCRAVWVGTLLLSCAHGNPLFIQRGGLSGSLPIPTPPNDGTANIMQGGRVAISNSGTRVVIRSGTGTVPGKVEAYDYDQITDTFTAVGGDVVTDATGGTGGGNEGNAQNVAISPNGLRIAVGYTGDGGEPSRVVVKELQGTWTDIATINSPEAGILFGHAVSLTDNYLAIGAAFKNSGGNTDAGEVYIYDLSDTTAPIQTLAGTAAGDMLGYSVSLVQILPTELWVACGAPQLGTASGGSSVRPTSAGGKIFPFRGNPTTTDNWELIQPAPFQGADDEECGRSVSFSVTIPIILAYGCPAKKDGSNKAVGRVATWFYDEGCQEASCWKSKGADGQNAINPNGMTPEARDTRIGGLAGISVALSANGRRLAVGSIRSDKSRPDSDGNPVAAGTVGVYELQGNPESWQLVTEPPLRLEGQASTDSFGWSVALDRTGDTVVVGAYGEGVQPGKATVYDLILDSSTEAAVNADEARLRLVGQAIDQLQKDARLTTYKIWPEYDPTVDPIPSELYIQIKITAPEVPEGLSNTGSNTALSPVIAESFLITPPFPTNPPTPLNLNAPRVRSFAPLAGSSPLEPDPSTEVKDTPEAYATDEFFVKEEDWLHTGLANPAKPGCFQLTLVRTLAKGPTSPSTVPYAASTWTLELIALEGTVKTRLLYSIPSDVEGTAGDNARKLPESDGINPTTRRLSQKPKSRARRLSSTTVVADLELQRGGVKADYPIYTEDSSTVFAVISLDALTLKYDGLRVTEVKITKRSDPAFSASPSVTLNPPLVAETEFATSQNINIQLAGALDQTCLDCEIEILYALSTA